MHEHDTSKPGETTRQIQRGLDRLRGGDMAARSFLLEIAQDRLRRLAAAMLHQDPRVQRWETSSDVLQEACIKLDRALGQVTPSDARAFFGLAALQMRRVLRDMFRHHYGKEGHGPRHVSDNRRENYSGGGNLLWEIQPNNGLGPATRAERAELHAYIDQLPDEEREVIDLHFYFGLTHKEAAELLGVVERTVKRRYRDARLHLYDLLKGSGWAS